MVFIVQLLIIRHEHIAILCVLILKRPSTAMVNVVVIPVAMKQNSGGGMETVTVSEMKLLVLLSASGLIVDDRQL